MIIIVNIPDGWLDGIDFPLLFLVKEMPGVLTFIFSSSCFLPSLHFQGSALLYYFVHKLVSDISLHSCFAWSLVGPSAWSSYHLNIVVI